MSSLNVYFDIILYKKKNNSKCSEFGVGIIKVVFGARGVCGPPDIKLLLFINLNESVAVWMENRSMTNGH